MRNLRNQNKSEPKQKNVEIDHSFNKAISVVEKEARKSTGMSTPLEASQDVSLLSELKKLKIENERLRTEKGQFGANEQKVLSAIKSEIANQSTDRPIMSRAIFKGSYGMNEKYLSPAIDALLDKKIINRHPAKKNGQNTFSWEILQ